LKLKIRPQVKGTLPKTGCDWGASFIQVVVVGVEKD